MTSELEAFGYSGVENPDIHWLSITSTSIAERSGLGATRKLVIVTAHLDSINIAGGSAADAPGADDNGTGSAGVIGVGRLMGEQEYSHDFRLILFGGEEQGLHGSQQYVAGLSQTDRDRLDGVINMDMIGI